MLGHYIYPATLVPDEGGFVVTFADIPEAISQGDDLRHALDEAADALEEAVAAYLDTGRALPPPSPAGPCDHLITLPAATACKAILTAALAEAGLSKSELARRLDIDPREARRMLDPRHPTKIDRMEEALRALGYRLDLHAIAA